jgi:hypothetical protein
MTDAWIPISIFGLPFLGMLVLSAIYKGGTSTSLRSTVGETPLSPRGYRTRGDDLANGELELISQLSGHASPGAISRLSGPVSPGAISTLSRWRSPGAISTLSGHVSPGAISRLSGRTSPGAISRLSAPRPVGAIANLSAGFFVSHVFGLPLLTRSQAPLEPDDSLLTSDRVTSDRGSGAERSSAAEQRPTGRNVDRSRASAGRYGVGG